MFDCFMPDRIFERFDDVTAQFLAKEKIRFLLVDIDNTLAPYEEPDPNERVTAWVASMRDAGVTVVLVSNNNAERVRRFNKTLGLVAYADCHKPSPKRLRQYAESVGANIEETAALGDQIFTDVWGAKCIGARALLVPPINDKKTLFFRFKRSLEKPFLKRYYKKHGGEK